jgi:hypothetical protein
MITLKFPHGASVLCVAALLLTAACTSTPLGDANASSTGQPSGQAGSGAGTFATGLMPPGSVIKQDQSFIVGNGENWFGKVTLDIGKDDDIAYKFFLKTLPEKGWTLVSTIRSEQTQLVFTKSDRSATVVITPASFWKSGTVTMVITPTQSR